MEEKQKPIDRSALAAMDGESFAVCVTQNRPPGKQTNA